MTLLVVALGAVVTAAGGARVVERRRELMAHAGDRYELVRHHHLLHSPWLAVAIGVALVAFGLGTLLMG